MKHISITAKILGMIALLGLFVLGVAVYSAREMRAISASYAALIGGTDTAALALDRANRAFEEGRANLALLTISNSDAITMLATSDLNQSRAALGQFFDEAIKAAPAAAAEVGGLRARVSKLLDGTCANAISSAESASTPSDLATAQGAFLGQCAMGYIPISQAIKDSVSHLAAAAHDASLALRIKTAWIIRMTFAGILGGLLLVALLALVGARRWILRPLRSQLDSMDRLSRGDYDADISETGRRDEIGAMARSVLGFRDSGREKRRLEGEAAEQRRRADALAAEDAARRAEVARQSASVVGSLAEGLSHLAEGDLQFRLEQPFAGDYEKLRTDFNAAIMKLQDTIATISAAISGIRSGSSEVTEASDDLARRTEHQAASLEQTAAALDEITAAVRRTSENAHEARSTVSAAQDDADKSGSIVRQTVEAMNAIATSSKQVGNIIGVIDEIAFQTNLLALNAGVEAARAGDAGRGFAVVATEVRALAQRSADAAKEIKALISSSGRQVEAGVRLVGETGTALGRIVGEVSRLNSLIGDIAASAAEQATGLAEVNTSVNQMDQVTQQNAAMVEQATAASHGLAAEAEALNRLVAQFQIGDSEEPPAGTEIHAGPTGFRASPLLDAEPDSRDARAQASAD